MRLQELSRRVRKAVGQKSSYETSEAKANLLAFRLENGEYNARGPVYHETMAAEECYKVGSCDNSVLDVGPLCRRIENKSSDTPSLEFEGKALASSDGNYKIGTPETEMKSNLQIPKRPSDLSSTLKSSDEDDDTSENIKLMAVNANKFIKQENWPKAERFIKDMFRIAERQGIESLPIMAAEQWNLWLGTAQIHLARYNDALSTFGTIDAKQLETAAWIEHWQGYCYINLGNLNLAKKHCSSTIKRWQDIGRPDRVEESMRNMIDILQNMGGDEDELGMYQSMLSLLLSAQAQPKGVLGGNWVRDQAKGMTRSGAIVTSATAPSLLTDLETKRYILKHHKLDFGPDGMTIEGPEARITEAIGLAIGQGDMDLLTLLFDGVDRKFLELKCHSTGLTNSIGPLLYAVQLNRLEMASFLLDRGANLFVADKNKENVMNRAIFYSNCDMVELLIKAGYPPNGTPGTSNKIDISPPLHYVCQRQSSIAVILKIIATLVDAGADVNMRNGSGLTPLHVAAVTALNKEHTTTILFQELLDRGADIHAKDRDGNTVLHYASRWRLTVEEIKVLLDYGADLQARNLGGQIPQKYADRETRGILAPPPSNIVIAASSSIL